jgi:hypothetical protein
MVLTCGTQTHKIGMLPCPLIANMFSQDATNVILQVPIVHGEEEDIPVWNLATKGICTTKEAYKFLSQLLQVQLPMQGTQSILTEAMNILETQKPCLHA